MTTCSSRTPGRRGLSSVNQWSRQPPASGALSPKSWEYYARVVREWIEFLSEHVVGLFDSRGRLKQALGKYAEYRAAGPAATGGGDLGAST